MGTCFTKIEKNHPKQKRKSKKKSCFPRRGKKNRHPKTHKMQSSPKRHRAITCLPKRHISRKRGTCMATGSELNPLYEAPAEHVANPDDVSISVKSREPSPLPKTETVLFRALYDYEALHKDDVILKKGDILEIPESSQIHNDWWIGRNQRTGMLGYVPSSFVGKNDDSPESQEWWVDTKRAEANMKLMLPGYAVGTFLIRPATNKSYALSIRNKDDGDLNIVLHYQILKNENGNYFVTPNKSFSTIVQLVNYYKVSPGLCCKLTKPYPKVPPVVQFRELEVDRDKIQMMEEIGHGYFGEVFKAKLHNLVIVAVKKLKPNTMTTKRFLEEAQSMHGLRHPKLVSLIGICTTSEPIFIITEYMENGSLRDFMKDKANAQHLKLHTLINMAGQIADGMNFLTSKNYVHRDLRAANILVGHDYNVKIADFGLARLLIEDAYTTGLEKKFPVKWTAPEAAAKQKFSIKSDVWSFGVLMYEIITLGEIPYPGMTNKEVILKVKNGYRMPKPKGRIECPNWYYNSMVKCWKKNPQNRPTFEYLYNLFVDESTYRDGDTLTAKSNGTK